jgi:hypothetical protein
MMTVWPYGGNNKEYRHTGKKEYACLIIIFLTGKKEVNNHCGYIYKPQKIRDYEYFTKRNIIIRRHMNYMVVFSDIDLKPVKPHQINNTIQHKGYTVPVFA